MSRSLKLGFLLGCLSAVPFAVQAVSNGSYVTPLSVTAPAGVCAPGDAIDVVYSITNSGNNISAPLEVALYACIAQGINPATDTCLAHVTQAALAARTIESYTTRVTLSEGLPSGMLKIGIIVTNPLDAYPTSGKSKTSTNSFTVTASADLSVVSVDAANGVYPPGGTLGIQYQIVNRGSLASSPAQAAFFASPDVTITSGDYALPDAVALGTLAAHATHSGSATVTLPSALPPGNYYVGVLASCTNDLSTGNNSGYDRTWIAVTAANAALGGHVTDKASGTAVEGAVVRWGKRAAATDAGGHYLLSDIPSGTCCLTVTRAGFSIWEASYTLPANTTGVKDVQLSHLAPPVVSNVAATNRVSVVPNQKTKQVDIWYDLETPGDSCSVSVLVSTNRGVAYTLPATHFSGTGYGASVVPGQKKLITWDAGADWNNKVSIDMRVKVVASDGSVSDEESSNVFVLDTRDGTLPVVIVVRNRSFDSVEHACFLQGVGVNPPGFDPIPLVETIYADVDWNGLPPGSVRILSHSTAREWPMTQLADGRWACEITMSELQTEESLHAVAESGSGRTSTPMPLNCSIIPPPPLVGPFLYALPLLPELFASRLAYESPEISFNVFKGVKATPPANIPVFGGAAMEIQPSVEMSTEIGSDGSGKFGVALAYEGSRKYGGKGRKKLGNTQLRGQNGRFGTAMAFSLTPSFEGEVRLKYELDHLRWDADGYIGVGLSAKLTSPSYPFVYPTVPPIPGYVKGELTAEIKALCAIPSGVPFIGSEGDLDPTFRLPGELQTFVILGAGVADMVNIEGFLGGGPKFEFFGPPATCKEFGILLNGGLRFQVLFYSANLINLEYEWRLVENGQWLRLEPNTPRMGLSQNALVAVINGLATDSFRLLPRAYLSDLTRHAVFCANTTGARELSGTAPLGLISDDVFQANVYPNSEPALAVEGTNTLMVWIYDNSSRTSVNRTQLQVSRRTAGVWSTPMPVWDDATADFAPRLGLFTNGTALAAWQNERGVLPEGASLGEALENSEIAYGHFNGTAWSCSNLTQNTYLDHSPQLSVAKNGTALLAWTANADNNYVGALSNRNSFAFTKWTGSAWNTPGVIASSIGMTLWTALTFNGSEGVFLAAVDADDDQMTPDDQEIYGAFYSNNVWGAWTRLTSNSVQDTRPQAVFDAAGTLIVAWVQGSNFMTCASLALAGGTVVSQAGGSSSAKDFRLITGPAGQVTLLWEDVPEGGGGPSPLVVNYDTALRSWSRPVALVTNALLESSFSGAYSPTGSLLLAYNQVYTPLTEDNVPIWSNQVVNLCFMEHILDADPAVDADEVLLPSSPVPGQTTDVSVVVRNLGEMAVTNLTVAFYEGHPATNGYMIAEPLVLSNALAGGDSVTVTQRWVVPETGSSKTFCVVVDPYLLQQDRNRGNNTAAGRIMDPDAVIPDAWVLETGPGNRVIKASVYNSGAVAITNAFAVTFRRGATNGPVLATVPVAYLGADAVYEAAFVWDMRGSTFTSAFETVAIEADATQVIYEEYEDNNMRLVQVMTPLDSDGDGTPDGKEMRSGTSPTVADSDGDGLTDTDEMILHGTDPAKLDTDGDGVKDGNEISAGTNPLDETDLFTITDVLVGGVANQVLWAAKAGRGYTVLASTNLLGAWVNAPDGAAAWEKHNQTALSNGVMVYRHTVSNTNAAPWFYRVRTP